MKQTCTLLGFCNLLVLGPPSIFSNGYVDINHITTILKFEVLVVMVCKRTLCVCVGVGGGGGI
jgi:hypothetical protein